jgi:phage I-like protein
MEQFALMQNQVAALSRQIETSERNELLEAALADGRILPAQKEYWAGQSLAALQAYMKVAQPLAALVGTQTGGVPPNGSGVAALTADQAKIAKNLGLDTEKYAKALATKAA